MKIAGLYELFEELGRGSFGVVHRARQLSLGRDVALKLFAPAPVTSEQVARFRRELETATLIGHPGIARVFDSGEHDGHRELSPHVSALVASPATPLGSRAALSEVLGRLGQVDVVAEHLGLAPPFDVRRALAPAVEVEVPAAAPAALLPLLEGPVRMVFIASEDPARGGSLVQVLGESAMDTNESLRGTEKCAAVELRAPPVAGDSVRLWMQVGSLPPES